jgi:hypothetical protein
VKCKQNYSTAFTVIISDFKLGSYFNTNNCYNFPFSIMGCNQSAAVTTQQAKVSEIPCTPEDIGRYINDIRANPSKYAALLEKEI